MPVGFPDRELRRRWLYAALLCGVISVAKGLRSPNLWSATQAQINCQYGFVKRCLFGQTWHWLGIPVQHYAVFLLISAALFAGFIASLIMFIRNSKLAETQLGAAVVAVFSSSFALSYVTNLIGYLDIPLAILALAAAGASKRVRAPAIGGAALVGVLIHEDYLFVFLPVTLLPLILPALVNPNSPRRAAWPLTQASLIALGAVVLVIQLALAKPMSAAALAALRQHIAVSTDFPVREDFFQVFARSLRDNLRIMSGYARQRFWWDHQVLGVLAFFPTIAFMAPLAWKTLKTVGGLQRTCLLVVVSGAVLSPLLMNVLGWDIYRWQALVVINAFIAIGILSSSGLLDFQAIDRRSASGFLFLAGLLMLANMSTGLPLFDLDPVNTPPFAGVLDFSRALVNNHGAWPVPTH